MASRTAAIRSACRWVGACPSTAVRKRSRSSRYTVAAVQAVTVAVRGMTRTESANTLVIWQLTVLAFFHSFLLLFGWRSPSAIDAAMLFGTGFTNAIGQWFWTKALHLAPAPAVTPFYYLMLVWALMFGFFVWGDIPSASLLVGSAIVAMTGLFLFLREARLQRRLTPR